MQKTRNFNKLNIFLHCLALVRGQAAERTYIAEYTYDENGIKTSVNAEGKTTYFIYEGNTLLGQYTDNDGTIENAMQFLYDENGEIQGVQHNGRMYYYQKDIMGNVYTVRNASGGSSGAYKYEAYGHNFFGYDGNDPFRNINPIKYRGYYYDSYYGGYYNLSRYYNPGMGRFLNLDDPMIALQSKSDPDGMNLYTYCNNDPVNNVDYDGYKANSKKIHVFYYYHKESDNNLNKQAKNSYYYNYRSSSVVAHKVGKSSDFIKAWNDMTNIDDIYLYLHGGKGKLYFYKDTIKAKDLYRKLDQKKISGSVFLFSCHGGDGSKENNIANVFAKLTSRVVYAAKVGVSYFRDSKNFKYYARIESEYFFSHSWWYFEAKYSKKKWTYYETCIVGTKLLK